MQSPSVAGADYRNRIWATPGEMPFAGHPSLGTAVAVARARGQAAASYVLQTWVGLPIGAGDPQLEPQVVSTGVAHLIVPLEDRAALAAAAPERQALRGLLAPLDATVLHLAVIDAGARAARARGFFLDPGAITEDPAS